MRVRTTPRRDLKGTPPLPLTAGASSVLSEGLQWDLGIHSTSKEYFRVPYSVSTHRPPLVDRTWAPGDTARTQSWSIPSPGRERNGAVAPMASACCAIQSLLQLPVSNCVWAKARGCGCRSEPGLGWGHLRSRGQYMRTPEKGKL